MLILCPHLNTRFETIMLPPNTAMHRVCVSGDRYGGGGIRLKTA